jgi:hypothetical protein
MCARRLDVDLLDRPWLVEPGAQCRSDLHG